MTVKSIVVSVNIILNKEYTRTIQRVCLLSDLLNVNLIDRNSTHVC